MEKNSHQVHNNFTDSHGLKKAWRSPPGSDLGRNNINEASHKTTRELTENQAMANL